MTNTDIGTLNNYLDTITINREMYNHAYASNGSRENVSNDHIESTLNGRSTVLLSILMYTDESISNRHIVNRHRHVQSSRIQTRATTYFTDRDIFLLGGRKREYLAPTPVIRPILSKDILIDDGHDDSHPH